MFCSAFWVSVAQTNLIGKLERRIRIQIRLLGRSFGSAPGLNPDSNGSVEPDPDPGRLKLSSKKEKNSFLSVSVELEAFPVV